MSNATRHTPGPWTAAGPSGNPGEGHVIEGTERTVAWTADTLNTETGDGHITAEDEANARLIAAAPEMYAELRTLLEVVGVDLDDPMALRQQVLTLAGRVRVLLDAIEGRE